MPQPFILQSIAAAEQAYLDRIEALEAEVQEWRDKYFTLLDDAIKGSGQQLAAVTKLVLSGQLSKRGRRAR